MLRKVVGGILLVAGTAVGAAVLALPVNTAHMGFQNAAFIFVICWTFMTLGALYLLEANLKVGTGSNIISIARHTTGPIGQGIAWFAYLMLLYALTSAYLIGAGNWLEAFLEHYGKHLPHYWQLLGATVITSFCILMGTMFVDYLNRALMIGLIVTYVVLCTVAFPHIDVSLLSHIGQTFDAKPITLIITAFGFAIIIPSLTLYLNGNTRALLQVVIIGSLLPLCIYLLWEALILGLIPYGGEMGLQALSARDRPAADLTHALQNLLGHPWIVKASHYFAIFALTTSLLGVTLSLFDFLADGLSVRKVGMRRVGLIFLTFVPPCIIVKYFPGEFTFTLKFAGIFVAILLGLLPVWMVWKGRYDRGLQSDFEVPGGKPVLLLTGLFFVGVIYLELAAKFHWYVP